MTASLNQIVHSRRRFLAWLGICAILMLFIAPVVSNTLVAQGMPMPMMGDMAMSSMNDANDVHEMSSMHDIPSMNDANDVHDMPSMNDMPSMQMSATPLSSPDAHPSDSAEHHQANQSLDAHQKIAVVQQADNMSPGEVMGAACGYCVLLMHLPLLVLLAVVFMSLLLGIVHPLFTRLVCCLVLSPTLTDSQPRAPPLSAGFASRIAA